MNRREFLKLGSAAIATAVFPEIAATADAVKSYAEVIEVEHQGRRFVAEGTTVKDMGGSHWAGFDPTCRYGNSLPLTYKPTPSLRKRLVTMLYDDMVKYVPPGYRDHVSIVQPPRTDFDRRGGIAWLYLPPGDRWVI